MEPEISFFDFKLYVHDRFCGSCTDTLTLSSLTTYATVLGLLSALGYFAYTTFAPQPKKTTRKPAVSAPVGTVTASGAGGYQEEWIPEHHLKKGKGKKVGALSSGDELSGLSGTESGAEGRKRKGRK